MKWLAKLAVVVITFVLISISFIFSPTKVQAATYGDYSYDITNGQVTITEYHGSKSAVFIPSSIRGYPVTAIGDSVFSNHYELTSVSIPNGITYIGESTFEWCSGLTSIILPDSVTTIGDYAFASCVNLRTLTIPNNIVDIGSGVVAGCDSLVYTTYDNAKYLGNSTNPYVVLVEYVAENITDCVVHEETKIILGHAFYCCYSLTSVTISGGVTSIGEYTFAYCYSLDTLTIPNSITSIGDSAFYDCTILEHVAYSGSPEQWNQISVGFNNDYLISAGKFHYNTQFVWVKNCVNSGMYCLVCNSFIAKDNSENGTHAYTDSTDISCNDCDFIQSVSSISVYQQPTILEYNLFAGVLDVADGILQVSYNDGGLRKVEMTSDMVSGFDNTQIGIQILMVTYEGKTTSYTVEIVPGTPNGVEILTMPETLNYITGTQLNLTGLCLLAYYPGDLTAEIHLADITVNSVDLSTPGIKTVKVGYKGVYSSFLIYVHTKQMVTLDSTTYPESNHNYTSSANESKTFTYPGADALTLTFNSSSYTESNYDWVYLYDGEGNQIGKYSGSLSGKVVTIPGDTFTIKLTSDGSVDKYGYAFSSIVAETILHTYENNTCTVCGNVETYSWTVTADATVNISLMEDLYIDLDGYNLSGTITTNGYKVYGMDSATNKYTCDTMGTFSCVDENGNAIIPESLYTTENMMRYLTIETENGYTFHRFYLGITNISLVPSVTGFGYKAEFYGDEMVQQQIASIGYHLWLDAGRVISKTANFKNTLTLRLKNFDVANYGNVPVNACVIITLTDGTVITGETHSNTMKQVVETVNSNYAAYTESQLAAVSAMIEANPIMQTWAVENIYKKEF